MVASIAVGTRVEGYSCPLMSTFMAIDQFSVRISELFIHHFMCLHSQCHLKEKQINACLIFLSRCAGAVLDIYVHNSPETVKELSPQLVVAGFEQSSHIRYNETCSTVPSKCVCKETHHEQVEAQCLLIMQAQIFYSLTLKEDLFSMN